MTSQSGGPGDWDPEDMDDPEYREDRELGIDPEDPDLDKGFNEQDSWDVKRERAELEDAMLEMEVDEAVAKLEAEEAGEDEDWDGDEGDEYGDEDYSEDPDEVKDGPDGRASRIEYRDMDEFPDPSSED